MIPLGDNIRPPRTPVMTYLLLAGTWAVWLLVQQGHDPQVVAATVCNLRMVPGEITHRVAVGFEVHGPGMACVIDNDRINICTPLLSIFLHGEWGHIIGNSIYLLVFGKNVEGGVGAIRFLVFYLVCGLVAAASSRSTRHPRFRPSVHRARSPESSGISRAVPARAHPDVLPSDLLLLDSRGARAAVLVR